MICLPAACSWLHWTSHRFADHLGTEMFVHTGGDNSRRVLLLRKCTRRISSRIVDAQSLLQFSELPYLSQNCGGAA